jgi:hypothetical protein
MIQNDIRILSTKKVKRQQDALKYAYAFMMSGLINRKECAFFNPNPQQYTKEYIFPRDMYSVTYRDKDLPLWEDFKKNPNHDNAFSCIACIDLADIKRITCSGLKNDILFACYGNYESEAKKVFKDIIKFAETLK